MAALIALPLQSALVGTAALLARRAKPAAILLGASAFFGAPWLAGSIPLLRGICGLAGWVSLMRIIDVVRFGDDWQAWRRVVHVVSFVDSRTRWPRPLRRAWTLTIMLVSSPLFVEPALRVLGCP